jgi:N-acetylglucosamine-6-phosphate deacetylase
MPNEIENPMRVVARSLESSQWIELEVQGGLIEQVRPGSGPSEPGPGDEWIAPAFWDIQVNGRSGYSFSSPDLTVEQTIDTILAQAAVGTARLCPTLITAPVDDMLHGVRTIAAACDRDSRVAARVAGIHLEGPFISEVEGYRGAHPASSIRDPDWILFKEIQAASGGRVVLMTLAPERPGSIDLIRRAKAAGVAIALGHTAASGTEIQAAVAAGAMLSTHLGNGIAALLCRHPNPIWEQAGLDDISASFIADGFHLDLATLRVLARAKGSDRTILISDASPLAGLPPGVYGEWSVERSGKIVVTGTPYLAGSCQGLDHGLRNLMRASGWMLEQAIKTVTNNPARLLGRSAPTLFAGQPASFVVFRRPELERFVLDRTCVDGHWAVA